MFEKPWKKDSDGKEESLSKIYVLAQKHIHNYGLSSRTEITKCREVLRQHRNLDMNVLYSHSMRFEVVFGRAWEVALVND